MRNTNAQQRPKQMELLDNGLTPGVQGALEELRRSIASMPESERARRVRRWRAIAGSVEGNVGLGDRYWH